MVEITEETSEPYRPASANYPTRSPTVSIMEFFRIESANILLPVTRLITIFCALFYALPFGAPVAQNTAYTRAFLAAAATNAIRLHQRVGGIQFSRTYFLRVIAEDACHYLLYSLLFINATPVTMALLPVFLYAVMHVMKFVSEFCVKTGNGLWIAQKLQDFLSQQTSNLLGVIACSEIFIMPLFVAMIFTGKGSIFFPFIYYRFLAFRYMSRRNESTRIAFHQLRLSLENAVSSPNCPSILRNIAYNFINFICRLCPNQV